jgi:hypothetical protein
MRIISAIFQASAIIVEFGKLSTILPFRLATKKAGPWWTLPSHFLIANGWLTLPEPPPAHQSQEAGAEKEHGGGGQVS